MADDNKLEVNISGNSSMLKKAFDAAVQQLKNFEKIASSILDNTGVSTQALIANISNLKGAFDLFHSAISSIIGTIQNFVNGLIHLGDTMDKTLLQTGISVETLVG